MQAEQGVPLILFAYPYPCIVFVCTRYALAHLLEKSGNSDARYVNDESGIVHVKRAKDSSVPMSCAFSNSTSPWLAYNLENTLYNTTLDDFIDRFCKAMKHMHNHRRHVSQVLLVCPPILTRVLRIVVAEGIHLVSSKYDEGMELLRELLGGIDREDVITLLEKIEGYVDPQISADIANLPSPDSYFEDK